MISCSPEVSAATSALPARKLFQIDELVGVHAVQVDELPGEDVGPGGAEQVVLRDQGGRAETVSRDGALDDGRRELGLGEVRGGLLGEHRPEQLLAAGHVLALRRDHERLAGRAVQRLVRHRRARPTPSSPGTRSS